MKRQHKLVRHRSAGEVVALAALSLILAFLWVVCVGLAWWHGGTWQALFIIGLTVMAGILTWLLDR